MLVVLWFAMIGFIILVGFGVVMATFIHWVRTLSAPPQEGAVAAAPASPESAP